MALEGHRHSVNALLCAHVAFTSEILAGTEGVVRLKGGAGREVQAGGGVRQHPPEAPAGGSGRCCRQLRLRRWAPPPLPMT